MTVLKSLLYFLILSNLLFPLIHSTQAARVFEDKDFGVHEENGFLCNKKWEYVAYLKGSYDPPRMQNGEDEEVFVNARIEALHIDAVGAYQSAGTLCDLVAAELEARLTDITLELILTPEERDGKIEFNPLFTKIDIGDLKIDNPNAPRWVENWLKNFINGKLKDTLASEMASQVSQEIFDKMKDKIMK